VSASGRYRVFRSVAFVEGVTTLALCLVAMPIKYLAGNPEPVQITGWIHGTFLNDPWPKDREHR